MIGRSVDFDNLTEYKTKSQTSITKGSPSSSGSVVLYTPLITASPSKPQVASKSAGQILKPVEKITPDSSFIKNQVQIDQEKAKDYTPLSTTKQDVMETNTSISMTGPFVPDSLKNLQPLGNSSQASGGGIWDFLDNALDTVTGKINDATKNIKLPQASVKTDVGLDVPTMGIIALILLFIIKR